MPRRLHRKYARVSPIGRSNNGPLILETLIQPETTVILDKYYWNYGGARRLDRFESVRADTFNVFINGIDKRKLHYTDLSAQAPHMSGVQNQNLSWHILQEKKIKLQVLYVFVCSTYNIIMVY